MEVIAKALVIAMAAALLLCGLYVGIRTARDPVWCVQWFNRLNGGDPRDYRAEWRDQWWARWNLMTRNPDLVRASPFLAWQYRAFGIAWAALSAVLLVALIVVAGQPISR